MMDSKAVGNQIAVLRKGKGLTQNDLGDRLGVSFQAVSKWERGECLPDTALLLDLAGVLETSVDHILTGGSPVLAYRGKVSLAQLKEGLLCLERMGALLGRDHLLYRNAIAGINERMNTDVEKAFSDEGIFECFLAEAVIQSLIAGKYIDLTEVKNGFQCAHYRDLVVKYCRRYGIK